MEEVLQRDAQLSKGMQPVCEPEAQGVSVDAEICVAAMCTPYDVLYQQVVALLMVSLLLCRCIVRGLYVS